jgi:hypothetical protein
VRVCKATSVPVVGADFPAKLQAAGLSYKIVYPIKDNGNGRGYIVWNNAVEPRYAGGNWPSVSGYARIEGVAWQNQFAAYSSVYPYGDIAGAFVAAQDSGVRETTIRLEIPGWLATIGTYSAVVAPTMLTDDWLAGTPTPPTPPVPAVPLTPPAPPATAVVASPTNAGSPSVGTGSGAGVGGADHEPGAAFDWDSYCRSPNPDGSQRTLGWIENCLATRH